MRTQICFVGLGFVFSLTAACSSAGFANPASDAGTEGGNVPPITGGGDSGAVDAAVEAAPPPGCDVTKLPTDDLCVVNDAEGVFVSSSTGSASGNGTRENPLASLDAAIVLAAKNKMRVYACAESYAESITFADGVNVFGYFDCNNGWIVGTPHAKVQSPTSPAAVAMNIASATRIEALDIIAPDFVDQSHSSIGLVANTSPGLTIKNATIHAGLGGKGLDGVNGTQLTDSGVKNGGNATTDMVCTGNFCLVPFPGKGGASTCAGEAGHDPGPGGNGGSGGVFLSQNGSWVTQSARTDGLPTVASATTTAGGSVSFAPLNGANGAAGTDGSSGLLFGGITPADVYIPSDGTNATSGSPGQGAGGSAGYALYQSDDYYAPSYTGKTGYGDNGAGGGSGGCPGLAGAAGKGGGASIAIVATQSIFTLDTVIVESSRGGDGGASGMSSSITSGGLGGAKSLNAGVGANGGNGGNAGVSGNGGGGPSIGIAWQSGAPTELAVTITVGNGGNGVLARTDLGNGKIIPASMNGMSAATYAYGL